MFMRWVSGWRVRRCFVVYQTHSTHYMRFRLLGGPAQNILDQFTPVFRHPIMIALMKTFLNTRCHWYIYGAFVRSVLLCYIFIMNSIIGLEMCADVFSLLYHKKIPQNDKNMYFYLIYGYGSAVCASNIQVVQWAERLPLLFQHLNVVTTCKCEPSPQIWPGCSGSSEINGFLTTINSFTLLFFQLWPLKTFKALVIFHQKMQTSQASPQRVFTELRKLELICCSIHLNTF